MTTRESQTIAIKPMYRATCVSSIFFPKEDRWVETQNRWALGQDRKGRWCATNGKGNGLWFRSRAALVAYANYLTSRDWEVKAVA